MEIAIWLVVGLVVGGVIGAMATWMISRARGGAVSVMQLKQENDKFRNEVTEHFVETARLINQMTDSYKQVFDHLSSGAEKLVDNKSLAERLPPASGEEVKLSQFGASASADNSGGASKQGERSGAGLSPSGGKDEPAKSGAGTSAPERPDERSESKTSEPGAPESKTSNAKPGGVDPLKSKPGASAPSQPRSGDSKLDSKKESTARAASGKPEENSGDRKDGKTESDPARNQVKGASASNQSTGKPGARD